MSVFSRLLDLIDGSQEEITPMNSFPSPQPPPRVEHPLVVDDDPRKLQNVSGSRPPIVFTNGKE